MNSTALRALFFPLLLLLLFSVQLPAVSAGEHVNDVIFMRKLDSAMQRVAAILDSEREFGHPGDVSHTYEDKYLLAEYLTKVLMHASKTVLEKIGLTSEKLADLRRRSLSGNSSVVVDLVQEDRFDFQRQQERELDAPTQVVEKTGFLGKYREETKVTQKVTEYVWKHETTYKLSAKLSREDSVIPLLTEKYAVDDIRRKKVDLQALKVAKVGPLDITWLVRHLGEAEAEPEFAIDRSAADCATPRRNRNVEEALYHFDQIYQFNARALQLISRNLLAASGLPDLLPYASRIESPVISLFDAETGTVLKTRDALGLLENHKKSLRTEVGLLAKTLEASKPARELEKPSLQALSIIPLLQHWSMLLEHHLDAINGIEQLLRIQLVHSIGKEMSSKDFRQYMRFHLEKRLFKPNFTPKPFTYAVRRQGHSPEGSISIHHTPGPDSERELIETFVRKTGTRNMSFALNAATKVSFNGPHYVHSFLDHQLGASLTHTDSAELRLIARARQFSSFILVLGKIKSGEEFDAKYAITIENKDELSIPLILEQIPSAKAFESYIVSLSPEQQRFAKAFRTMQLEGTTFGLATIQIKPAMEKVLNLPSGSLTKEIQLTQDLMQLFTKYQIPTDLLSYSHSGSDGESSSEDSRSLEQVRGHVGRMMALIDKQKEKIAKAQQLKHEYKKAQKKEEKIEMFAASSTKGTATGSRLYRKGPASSPRIVTSNFDPQEVVAAGAAIMGATISAQASEDSKFLGGILLLDGDDILNKNEHAAESVHPDSSVDSEKHDESEGGTRKGDQGIEDNQGDEGIEGKTSHPFSVGDSSQEDYTRLAVSLDAVLKEKDSEGAVRPTHLVVGEKWQKQYQESILDEPKTLGIEPEKARREKDLAFDLLDALSRSGAITLEDSNLHVIIAATHRFDKTLLDTVIQDNINPIDKMEKSAMLVAAEAHKSDSVSKMILEEALARIVE